ncbi:OpgC domain-containing protein [Emcibacter sp. SYSU 3D8]|uniref:OpgC family protein n=1 Tax=Emcibacter sp. SYSU 3D8 TaxID=3133969 RepID=UPI0031FE462A
MTAATPQAPERYEVLDGLRGYFLVFMLLNHLSFQYSYFLVKVNHGELGFVQDAQGFVFLSGLLIGMVYAGRMTSRGLLATGTIMWRRALELFVYAVSCLAIILVLARLLPSAQAAWKPWLGDLLGGGPAYKVAALFLLYQPTYMDILPQYIVYLIAAPPLLWLCVHGKWHWMAIGSALLWFCVQIGFHLPLSGYIDDALDSAKGGLAMRTTFNMLAWQIVFMGGMVLGTLTRRGTIDWRGVFSPGRRVLMNASLAVVVFFMCIKLGWTAGLLPAEMLARFGEFNNRPEFSTVYLLNFAALAYLVGWLLTAGPQSSRRFERLVGALLNRLFRLRFLRLLGRHSLQVYAWHVVLVYLLAALDRQTGPLDELVKNLLAVMAVAALALPALWRERRAIFSAEPDLASAKP